LIKQVPDEEWDSMYGYEFLCELPYSVQEVCDRFGIKFEEYLEDGLGECFAAIVQVEDSLYFLRGFGDMAQKEIGVCVNMPGDHPDPQLGLEQVAANFEASIPDMAHICEDLSQPRWILTRQGDDGNEVEMHRFLREHTANWVMKKYTERGHKQCYLVREET